MAAVNQNPIFVRLGDVSANCTPNTTANMSSVALTATADYTGVSTNHKLVFTADATNGSYLQRLRFKPTGTATASVARIYINNGGVPTQATNNAFYGEVSLPPVVLTNTSAHIEIDQPMLLALPPGFRIYVGLGTTVAAGWSIFPVGGLY